MARQRLNPHETTSRVCVSLDSETLAMLSAVGNGNVSAGCRKLAELARSMGLGPIPAAPVLKPAEGLARWTHQPVSKDGTEALLAG